MQRNYILIILFLSLAFFSCEIYTPNEGGKGQTAPGRDLVINEVYFTSPSIYYAYSWIEIYNPMDSAYQWYSEKRVNDTTVEIEHLMLRFNAHLKFYYIGNTSYIYYETDMTVCVSNYGHYYDEDRVVRGAYVTNNHDIPGKSFALIVSNKGIFDRHFREGASDHSVLEPRLPFDSNQGTLQPVVFLPSNSIDTTDEKTYLFWAPAFWSLVPSNEVALLRVKQTVTRSKRVLAVDTTYVDVVRFGNYRPTPDPFPAHISFGNINEGYSLARYASYFKVIHKPYDINTTSTIDAFYMTDKPLPAWYSQFEKDK